ncbi:hypothetical protein pb186bvf_020456 [Paramecium bursaria]
MFQIFALLLQVQAGIVQLTDANLEQAIKDTPVILIDFYAYWCAPCRQFEPEYHQLSERFRNESSQIVVASFDSARDPDRYAITKYKIISFPTFILFIQGRSFYFEGQRSADALYRWVSQLTDGPNPIEISNKQQLENLIKQDVVLYYQGNAYTENTNYWIFYEYCKTSSDVTFAYSVIPNIIENTKEGGLYLYSNGERKVFQQAFTKQNLRVFVKRQILPLVPQLSTQTSDILYQGTSIILFVGVDEASQRIEKAFFDVASKFQNVYNFFFSRVTDQQFFIELENLGADDNVFPKLVIFNNQDKYKYNGPDFTSKGIKDFIFAFRQGKVDKYIKSEPLPEKQPRYVKKIVGYNFDEEVLKTNKDVLLEFYADWCHACKQFKPTYELLGYELRNNPNVVVAQINAPKNEFGGSYKPSSYPDIVFYKGSEKVKKAVPFTDIDNRDVKTLIEFIGNHTSYKN